MIDQTILMPTGDPQFQYDFRASLVSLNSLAKGDYIEFDNLPDYASASFTSAIYGNNLFLVSSADAGGAHQRPVHVSARWGPLESRGRAISRSATSSWRRPMITTRTTSPPG